MLIGLEIWSFDQTLGFMGLGVGVLMYQALKAAKSHLDTTKTVAKSLWTMWKG